MGAPARVVGRKPGGAGSGLFGEVGAGRQIAPDCTRIPADHGLPDEARWLGAVPAGMVVRDAPGARELTRLDLRDLERRYG